MGEIILVKYYFTFCIYLFESDRKVWDAVTGDEVLTLAHKHIVKSVNFTQVRLEMDRARCSQQLQISILE